MPSQPPLSRLTRRLRRTALRANVAASLVLAVAIFAMVHHLSMSYSARWHAHRSLSTRLSPRTTHLLETVPEDIRIVVLLRPANDLYRDVRNLLREYAARGTVTVEFVDPDSDLAHTELLVRQYRLDGAECIVFEMGGRHQTVLATDLVEYGYPPDDNGRVRRHLFHGEQRFSNAIYALSQAVRPTVHFIQGHGERSPVDFDRRTGFSRMAARLRDENLDVETLHLGEAKAVPNHCALMIIAGPTREFAPFEIALIRDYLDRKGRLLLLLDARMHTGLEPLLRNWGILLGDDIVVDPAQTLTGRELYLTTYADHPITAPLQGIASVFFLPRSIRALPFTAGGDKPVLYELASSSDLGWAEFSPDAAAPRFDPRVDIPGPVPVAVAVERGPIPGVHVQILPTRLVVIGDSGFASNGGLMGANADLFLNSVNWLLEREELLSVSPRILTELRLVINRRQLHRLFAAVVVGLPGLVALAGLAVAWRRRPVA